MSPDSKKNSLQGNDQQQDQKATENEITKAAHEQAEADMQQDADLSIHSPNDDLDEAETAKLGEDETGLV